MAGAMMAGGLLKETRAAFNRAPFHIGSAVDQLSNAGKGYGAGTHGAGLKRDKQPAAGQSFVTKGSRPMAQHQDLGMGGGIFELNGAVAICCKHVTGFGRDQNRTDRHLAAVTGGYGFGHGPRHIVLIAHHHGAHHAIPALRRQGDLLWRGQMRIEN